MSHPKPSTVAGTGAAATGAGVAALAAAASACCATPTLAVMTVTLLGASGAAWAAGLERWAPWLLLGSALAVVVGYVLVARAARGCAHGSRSLRFSRLALHLSTLIWLVAALIRYAPGIFGGSS